MLATVEKWGDSLAIRIPAEEVSRLNLVEGSRVRAVLSHPAAPDFTGFAFVDGGLEGSSTHDEVYS